MIEAATPPQQPYCQARAGVAVTSNCTFRPVIPLTDHRAVADFRTGHEVANLEPNQIAAPQLAVDRQVEQGAVAEPLLAIQQEPGSPNLLLGEQTLCADGSAGIPHNAVLHGGIEVRVGHHLSPWP